MQVGFEFYCSCWILQLHSIAAAADTAGSGLSFPPMTKAGTRNELDEKRHPTDRPNFMYRMERQKQDTANAYHKQIATLAQISPPSAPSQSSWRPWCTWKRLVTQRVRK
jgi:hypothetical protein